MNEKFSVLPDRLDRFMRPEFRLRRGAGRGINGEADICLMQAVGWLAGEADFSDFPDCACPVIQTYCVVLNDSDLFQEHRDALKPFAPRIVGTRNGPTSCIRRALICCDYSVRALSPIILCAAGEEAWAQELEALEPITGVASAKAAKLAAERIGAAARASASDTAWAARGAASDAAWAAARAAASDTAWAAARAARGAASDSARAAARAAASDTAWAAARAAMRAKFLECLDAMISV